MTINLYADATGHKPAGSPEGGQFAPAGGAAELHRRRETPILYAQDAATMSLAALGDPSQYRFLGSVPVFRAHKRKKEDGTEIVVTDDDLREIAEHMQALEEDGRIFRVTNGHINPAGDEDEQPELLAFAKNVSLSSFGPNSVPCVMWDEYGRVDKLSILQDRPYRSAEYYGKSKLITGAAALIRDPQLNLGAVLYNRSDGEPWLYAAAIKTEKTMADMNQPGATEASDSPEEVAQYEKMCQYMDRHLAKKYPKMFGPEAIGAMNAAPPEAVKPEEKKPEVPTMQRKTDETQEFYALRVEADTAKREAAEAKAVVNTIQRERLEERRTRETEVCQNIIDGLAQRYRLDPAKELKTLLPLSAAEREEHVAYIRANYADLPGGELIDLYRGHAEGGEEPVNPRTAPAKHQKALAILRANPGMQYDEAVEKASANGTGR